MSETEWYPIETAPRDGMMIRLRFRPALWMPEDAEIQGFWKETPDMPAKGFWSTLEGHYITPGPIKWTYIGRVH